MIDDAQALEVERLRLKSEAQAKTANDYQASSEMSSVLVRDTGDCNEHEPATPEPDLFTSVGDTQLQPVTMLYYRVSDHSANCIGIVHTSSARMHAIFA